MTTRNRHQTGSRRPRKQRTDDVIPAKFVQQMATLTAAQRVHFYALLACRLADQIHVILVCESDSDADKIEECHVLNQVLRRVTAMVCEVQIAPDKTTDERFYDFVRVVAENCPGIEVYILKVMVLCFGMLAWAAGPRQQQPDHAPTNS
jgi:hypothetical protein